MTLPFDIRVHLLIGSRLETGGPLRHLVPLFFVRDDSAGEEPVSFLQENVKKKVMKETLQPLSIYICRSCYMVVVAPLPPLLSVRRKHKVEYCRRAGLSFC
jgi:hypothetical protein